MQLAFRANPSAKTTGWLGLFMCSLGMLTVGCGGSKGTISGKVFYQGKPLTTGAVTFFPSSGGASFTSRIQPDGNYRVEKVPLGQAKLVIVPSTQGRGFRMPPGMEQAVKSGKVQLSEEARSKMPPGQKEALETASSPQESVTIPPQYTDPEKSGLECLVSGGSQTHDIELK